jgi:hypothetical protein
MQPWNVESQRLDVGGWRLNQQGSQSKQKINADSDGDYYICPYCNAHRFPGEVETIGGKTRLYKYDCCNNGTLRYHINFLKYMFLRSLIELEKKRKHSKFAKYYFGDDRAATLFRTHNKELNKLFAFVSHGVKPLLQEHKKQHQKCYNYLLGVLK